MFAFPASSSEMYGADTPIRSAKVSCVSPAFRRASRIARPASLEATELAEVRGTLLAASLSRLSAGDHLIRSGRYRRQLPLGRGGLRLLWRVRVDDNLRYKVSAAKGIRKVACPGFSVAIDAQLLPRLDIDDLQVIRMDEHALAEDLDFVAIRLNPREPAPLDLARLLVVDRATYLNGHHCRAPFLVSYRFRTDQNLSSWLNLPAVSQELASEGARKRKDAGLKQRLSPISQCFRPIGRQKHT